MKRAHVKAFLVATVAGAAVTALMSCGKSDGGSTDEHTPVGPQATVNPADYQGRPGQFAGLYTGYCAITTADRTYTNCTSRIRITKLGDRWTIRTKFQLTPANRSANSSAINITSEDDFQIRGNSLVRGHEVIGVIGEAGFALTRADSERTEGSPLTFKRVLVNTWEFAGRFSDDSGRSVLVSGRVQRGATQVGAGRRVRNSVP